MAMHQYFEVMALALRTLKSDNGLPLGCVHSSIT